MESRKCYSSFLFWAAIVGGLLFFAACKDGELLENLPPETRIFVEEINLSGENRLNSVIRLRWSGDDQDGYVVGYEISQDNVDWTYLEIQDSTFRLSLPPGASQADIPFYVRAIDNQGLTDPSPAFLSIPIQNTPPVATLDSINGIPDTVFVILSALWSVSDLDGANTLDSVFIKLNDGPWYGLSAGVNFITLLPENPTAAGQQSARVMVGAGPGTLPAPIKGLTLGGSNTLLLKAKDLTGTFSQVDTSQSFFVKAQTSDLLVIDSHASQEASDVYQPILATVAGRYDYLDIQQNPPGFWDPTFTSLIQLYDRIFWYSDDAQPAELGQQMYLEIAANSLQIFLNQGGKLLVSTKFSGSFSDPGVSSASPIYGYSPIDSFSTAEGQARIPTDSLAFPVNEALDRYPSLKSDRFITGADPFYPKNPANQLYQVQLVSSRGWTGPNTVAAYTRFNNGRFNQVFFSVELHNFNGTPGTLTDLFDRVLNQEFDW